LTIDELRGRLEQLPALQRQPAFTEKRIARLKEFEKRHRDLLTPRPPILQELFQMLEAEGARASQRAALLIDLIEQAPQPGRDYLKAHYIEGRPWYWCANRYHYSVEQIQRRAREALAKIAQAAPCGL